MKKLLVLISISYLSLTSQLQSISLAEYIQQHGMPQIQHHSLNLSHQHLTDLTGLQDIPNIHQVMCLKLSHNQLQTLPENIFNNFPNLVNLFLDNNQLQTLPARIFNNLSNLQNLLLHHNQLQTLPIGIFDGLDNLEEIILNHNQLQALPAGIFNGLFNLRKLYLNNNQLTTLPIDLFNGLSNLVKLYLKDNPFKPEFIITLHTMLRDNPHLIFLDNKLKNQALQEQPYSILLKLTAEYIVQNIENYRHRLYELPVDIIDQLPLPQHERSQLIADKISQNINQYQTILYQLRQDILDLLPLTPQQRAEVTARKRWLS